MFKKDWSCFGIQKHFWPWHPLKWVLSLNELFINTYNTIYFKGYLINLSNDIDNSCFDIAMLIDVEIVSYQSKRDIFARQLIT